MVAVTIWNEFRHEKANPAVAAIYPDGIHAVLAEALRQEGIEEVRTATLDEPRHGLTAELLDATDVLVWWGHRHHGEVADEVVDDVQARVLSGMGLVVLHSGHFSKLFRRLMGTPCSLSWRVHGEHGEKERLWTVAPGHPITAGVPEHFEIEREEMYGEPFAVPQPDELIFVSWFQGGEVFRSGCCYRRGRGRVFYFRPGHETFPSYHHSVVRRVVANGVRWAAPESRALLTFANTRTAPLEPLPPAAD